MMAFSVWNAVREFVAETAALLTQAVLGEPRRALAACDGYWCSQESQGWCGECGVMKTTYLRYKLVCGDSFCTYCHWAEWGRCCDYC